MTKQHLYEKTLKKEVHFKGKGLFTGKDVTVTLAPSEINRGIHFTKIFNGQQWRFAADHTSLFKSDERNTVLSSGDPGSEIYCVEHLMSARTNVEIRVEGNEIPILDGSSKMFVESIREVGLVVQEKEVDFFSLEMPLHICCGKAHIFALPSDHLRFSFTLNYPNHPILHSQFFTMQFRERSDQFYEKEIAPARTFCLYEEAQAMLESGMVKGGSLECAVIVKGEEILNIEGLRFDDEMVRHKILDMIGDLALIGKRVNAHFVGIRSGHQANQMMVQKVIEQLETYQEMAMQGVSK